MKEKINVALFASHYPGFFVLSELLSKPLSELINVSLVVTDDPLRDDSVCKRDERIWKYGFTDTEATMVRKLASRNKIQTWMSSIDSSEFRQLFRESKPDLVYMAVFGQHIGSDLVASVENRFWNLHPALDRQPWPNCSGPHAFEQVIASRDATFAVFLHEVVDGFDQGKQVMRSRPIPVPPASTAQSLNFLIGPQAAQTVSDHFFSAVLPVLRGGISVVSNS